MLTCNTRILYLPKVRGSTFETRSLVLGYSAVINTHCERLTLTKNFSHVDG